METLGGVAALLGAVLYAALFASYQACYGVLNIEPEEVGVNYVFVLSRSLVIALPITALAVYLAGFDRLLTIKRAPQPSLDRHIVNSLPLMP